MKPLTVTQRYFETRPKLFVLWISAWFTPLCMIFLTLWVCVHAARFPRMIWIYGLRDWLADAGEDFGRTMVIMPKAWWLSVKRASRSNMEVGNV